MENGELEHPPGLEQEFVDAKLDREFVPEAKHATRKQSMKATRRQTRRQAALARLYDEADSKLAKMYRRDARDDDGRGAARSWPRSYERLLEKLKNKREYLLRKAGRE